MRSNVAGPIVRSQLLLGASMAALLGAMPANAQTTPETPPEVITEDEVPPEDPVVAPQPIVEPDTTDTIVVTGSRIRRSSFSSPDPLTVIDPETAQLQGQFTTAEMLQSSPVAAGSSQVTSAISSAFVENGGPGVETISLRGLGAERTLVLLNGRRAGPAGTRGAISSFDLNVLPQSIVQSVEVLKTGASSIYGSDAIAGVVNLLTRRDTDGFQLDGHVSIPQESGGEEYRLSGLWGHKFDRGHIMVAADYFQRQMLQRRDRDYLNCPEEYIFRPGGRERADIVDPRTGEFRCNDLAWGHIWVYDYDFNLVGRWQADYGENLGQYIPVGNPPGFGTPPGFFRVGYNPPPESGLTLRDITAVDNFYHPFYGQESVVPATKRYTGYVDAGYELADWVEVGVELLHNRRETRSTSYRQFWYLTGFTEEFFPGFGDPFAEGWSGPFFLSPTPITDHFGSSTKVDYTRALGHLSGNYGNILNGWTWNGYLQYSHSDGDYTSDVILDDAVRSQNLRTSSCVGQTLPVSGRPCIDIDWTRPQFLAGNFTAEERAFLFDTETGNTIYKQWAGELSTTGTVLRLPAGPLDVAIGAAYRRDSINDVPGDVTRAPNPAFDPALSPDDPDFEPEFVNNSWGLTSAGVTAGHSVTKEAFGEINIPLFHNTPLIQSLTINAAGRVTNVTATRKSDGESFSDNGNLTYSVGANWEVSDWLRFRGRYGTSFRAPALFEQFLANQSSFFSQRQVDPCINWQMNLDNNVITPRLAENCAAAGVPGDHSGAGPSATAIQGGGLGVLEAETSTAKSVGVIFEPRFGFLPDTRLSVSVDYFDIDIDGEIGTLGAGAIVSGCYNSEFFPDEPLCDLFNRLPSGVSGEFNIDEITATFININRQRNRGIDVIANLRHNLGRWGDISLLAQMTWQLEDTVALFAGTETDLNGEAGEPEWVGDFNLIYNHPSDWSIFYGLDVIGATSNEQDYIDIFGDLCRTTTTYGEYCVDLTAPAKFYHSMSVTKRLERFELTLGVSNFMNTKPARVTVQGGNSLNGGTISTIGQSVYTSQYDFLGRRFFLSAKTRF